MTELSFLIELLLEHDLKTETKKSIASRIKEVEGTLTQSPQLRIPYVGSVSNTGSQPLQAASTLALMAKHGDMPPVVAAPPMPPIPVEVIAQTPLAAAAMNNRNEAIAHALSGKPEKGRTSPRKF